MTAEKVSKKNPGMMLLTTFLTLFVVNVVVIYLANLMFPNFVVLGTLAFSLPWSLFHSMIILSLIDTFTLPFVHWYEIKRQKMFSSKEWMVTYFLVNLVGVWLVARFSEQFGLGIKSFLVALVLAAILDVVQGVVMMQLSKIRRLSPQ